jgi:hypothetical protein
MKYKTLMQELEGTINRLKRVIESDPWEIELENQIRHLTVIYNELQKFNTVHDVTPKTLTWEESVEELNNQMK